MLGALNEFVQALGASTKKVLGQPLGKHALSSQQQGQSSQKRRKVAATQQQQQQQQCGSAVAAGIDSLHIGDKLPTPFGSAVVLQQATAMAAADYAACTSGSSDSSGSSGSAESSTKSLVHTVIYHLGSVICDSYYTPSHIFPTDPHTVDDLSVSCVVGVWISLACWFSSIHSLLTFFARC
jgi:hypothetical protein